MIRRRFPLPVGNPYTIVPAACPAVTFVVLESQAGLPAARPAAVASPAQAVLPPDDAEPTLTMDTSADAAEPATTPSPPALGAVAAVWRDALTDGVDDVQPYLLGGWMLGLTLLSGRLLLGALGAGRLCRGRRGIPDELARRAAALAKRLGFRGVPRVFSDSESLH